MCRVCVGILLLYSVHPYNMNRIANGDNQLPIICFNYHYITGSSAAPLNIIRIWMIRSFRIRILSIRQRQPQIPLTSMAPMASGGIHKGLQTEVARRIVRRHAGHVLELARSGDLRFRRQRCGFGAFRLLGRRPFATAGRAFVGRRRRWIGDQPFHLVPRFVRRLVRIVAEADDFGVVCGT